jgi:hypothetical protein
MWLFHLSLPLIGLWLLLAHPQLDLVGEDHGVHFWLILATALLNVGLAGLIGRARDGARQPGYRRTARRRGHVAVGGRAPPARQAQPVAAFELVTLREPATPATPEG